MCIKASLKLTVYFDNPFWKGVYEEVYEGKLRSCKIVFGPEPKDYDVQERFLSEFSGLKFSSPIPLEENFFETKVNPKRLQKLIRKQTAEIGVGTKAQQALKAENEANKIIRKRLSKDEKERLKEENYQKKQAKKKQKKRGH